MDRSEMIENDFCITFSTVNGSGSATANITLMRALFRMGIPVSGKTYSLPTFKVSRHGSRSGSAKKATWDV